MENCKRELNRQKQKLAIYINACAN